MIHLLLQGVCITLGDASVEVNRMMILDKFMLYKAVFAKMTHSAQLAFVING